MWHSSITTDITCWLKTPFNSSLPLLVLNNASGWQNTIWNFPCFTSSKFSSDLHMYSVYLSFSKPWTTLATISSLHELMPCSFNTDNWSFWIMLSGEITNTTRFSLVSSKMENNTFTIPNGKANDKITFALNHVGQCLPLFIF